MRVGVWGLGRDPSKGSSAASRLRPLLEEVGVIAEREDVRRVADAGERLPPQPVDAGEALALGGELAVDVVRLEDRLEVHPVALREGDWG